MASAGDLWSYVHELHRRVEAAAPEGMCALTEVEAVGGERFAPHVVEVRPPFLIFEIPGEERPEILFVRAEDVRRIRIRAIEPGEDDRPVGFRVGEIAPAE